MRTNREPLKTFNEMAAELGVTQNQLVGMLAADKSENKPKAVFKRARTADGQVRYYRPSELRSWFNSRVPAPVKKAIALLEAHGYTVMPSNAGIQPKATA